MLYLIGWCVLNFISHSAQRQACSPPIGLALRAAEADMRQWWEPGGELRSWNEAHTRSSSHRVVPCGSGRGSAPLNLKAAPAEWRAPSMRRLALILLPCAVAVLVHLWLAQRPCSIPLDNNTHSGTSGFSSFLPRNFFACEWVANFAFNAQRVSVVIVFEGVGTLVGLCAPARFFSVRKCECNSWVLLGVAGIMKACGSGLKRAEHLVPFSGCKLLVTYYQIWSSGQSGFSNRAK